MISLTKWQLFILLFILLINITVAESSSEIESAEESEGNAAIDKLTKEKCLARRHECCKSLNINDVNLIERCAQKDKPPKVNDPDKRKILKYLSCAVECTYKELNYMGSDNKLNMTMIRNDAVQKYGSHPKERDYYVAMYEYCKQRGSAQYKLVTKTPAAKILFIDACNPKLLLTFMCTVDYHKSHECPYFKWEGESDTPAADKCAEAQKRCYELDKS